MFHRHRPKTQLLRIIEPHIVLQLHNLKTVKLKLNFYFEKV